MHEKTLLYGALAATTIAAGFGLYKARTSSPNPVAITPVANIDGNKRLAEAEVPIRLTAADGTGLRLTAMHAAAAVEDPLALTELHLTFENPEDRQLEGTFRITLPQGASLSRFAMKIGNEWQEGEVVEKQRAREAYEDFLHRRQDPALMEQGAGNEFTARVFPIPARGTKEIIVAYSEVLEAGAPYVLPLRGLPMLGALDVDVHAAGSRAGEGQRGLDATFGVHQTQITPAQDFVVEGKQLPRSPGLRSGDLAIARVVPFAQSRPEPVRSAVVLVDTSASRGLGLADQVKTLRDVLARLPSDTTITVACFDQEIVQVYEGAASGFGDKERDAILARGALGASDVEQAIGWAASTAKRAKAKRVILLGDGVATAGEIDAQKLRDKVQALRDAGVDRMDAIAMGGIRDDAFLRTVVRGVLDRDGVVLDAKLGAEALARRLGEATSSGVPVKVEGATWSWPEKLDGLQAGDEVMVYAQIDAQKPVKISVGPQTVSPDLRTIDRPLVERAWAQAKIQSLIEAPLENAAKTKQDIVALSTRHRVLSPHTAMLVLETDGDYRRFGIDRNATADILTVKDGRIAVTQANRGLDVTKLALLEEQKTRENRARNAEDKRDGDRAKRKAGERAETTTTTTTPAVAASGFVAALEKPADIPRGGDAEEAQNRRTQLGRLDGTPSGPSGNTPARGALDDDLSGRLAAGGKQGGAHAGAGLTGGGEGGGGAAPPPPPAQAPAATATATAFASAAPPADPRPATGHRTTPPPQPTLVPPAARTPTTPATERDAAEAHVRPGTLVVEGGINEAEVQRILRGNANQLRACYTQALAQDPSLHGRVEVRVVIDVLGQVAMADVRQGPNEQVKTCFARTFRTMHFPAPGSGDARFTATFDLVGGRDVHVADTPPVPPPAASVPKALPYEGRFKVVMEDLASSKKDEALDEARRWYAEQPGDVMALVALGEALEARGDKRQAARAYGSILELFSFRADSRRFAGERLERLDDPFALRLAADTFGKAVDQRGDHPASHRLYAFSLLKKGEYEKAFQALEKGVRRTYPSGRFLGADRILKEDLGLVAAAWSKAEPGRRGEIMQKLHAAGGTVEDQPSLRFVLVWETDANDVDFHIYDGKNGHAYYGQRELASGGELYADVTTGYGPECFTIRGPKEKRAYPYTLQAHYYSRGPMGYGMGKLEIIDHDGKGGFAFEERPFVVMVDRAYVDLGTVERRSDATAMK
jgi:tetratricopeptide (TPR) repeat protein